LIVATIPVADFDAVTAASATCAELEPAAMNAVDEASAEVEGAVTVTVQVNSLSAADLSAAEVPLEVV